VRLTNVWLQTHIFRDSRVEKNINRLDGEKTDLHGVGKGEKFPIYERAKILFVYEYSWERKNSREKRTFSERGKTFPQTTPKSI
jgi:hypothetical protein